MMNAFKKSLLVSALSVASISGAQASDLLTVYGKLNVTAQSNDVAGDSKTTVQSNASRFGVKGDYEISSGFEAFYTIEYEVDTGGAKKENFTARNQFVGLKGSVGAVSLGRNDTMLKISQGNVDLYNDLAGDIKFLFDGENRIEQTVTYISPSLGGFKLGATYAAEDSASQTVVVNKVTESESGYSVAATYGDAALKESVFYAALAYDSKVKQNDILRATASVKVADLVLGAMYQRQEKSAGGDAQNGYLLSAAYTISDVVLKAQYQDMQDKGNSWSVGGDYKLSKPTKLLAFYTSRDLEAVANTDKYIGVGIEHKF